MQRITSRHNAVVARARAAGRGDVAELMLLDGTHLVADALSAGIELELVAITAEAEARPGVDALIRELTRGGVAVMPVTAPVLEAMTPVRTASGIVALARRPPLDVAGCFAPPTPVVVVAAEIQDPGNLGAIVRVAEAGGAAGVLTTAGSADAFGWKALRGSMGSALRTRIGRCESVEDAVEAARAHRCTIVATTPRGGRPFTEASLGGAIAILVGAEGAGLPAAIVDAADERVTIPMQSPVESLNAAVTAALLVYEARRQRSSQRHSTAPSSRAARGERGAG